jgi:superfamily II DNA helicase RecQ
MALRFFTIPTADPASAEAELNAVLSSHRVVSVDRRFVDQGSQSFWAICVDCISGVSEKIGGYSGKERIDYREKLTPEQFRVYAELRDLRKQLAQADAVPVYTVFTNDQLSKMVEGRVTTKAALEKIDGVGEARVVKYGPRFLDLLTKLLEVNHETNRPPV